MANSFSPNVLREQSVILRDIGDAIIVAPTGDQLLCSFGNLSGLKAINEDLMRLAGQPVPSSLNATDKRFNAGQFLAAAAPATVAAATAHGVKPMVVNMASTPTGADKRVLAQILTDQNAVLAKLR